MTLGSLFDGIAGFPLYGGRANSKGNEEKDKWTIPKVHYMGKRGRGFFE